MKFDYNEFKQLVKDFNEISKDYDNFMKQFITKQGMLMLALTKKNTPVDTGNLRNRWFPSGPYKYNNTYYYSVINNVKYASWIEDGHLIYNQYGGPYGWVKGKHMAKIALTEIELKLQQRYDTAFRKWLKQKGLV